MKASVILAVLFIALQIYSSVADIYLHSPRGSNDRLDGQNRNRNNANRLFDSQNNDRGGYNVGSLYHYEGSNLVTEWTAQHSCGNANNACEFILQYTCDDLIRDGTTETTIPDNAGNCYEGLCDVDPRYGRQESWESYRYCTKRSRNKGLYTAEQNMNNRNTAKHTRQNAAGTRYGYECAEERDYYPYWGPTVWRDISILTNDPQRCAAYKSESQNVKGRYYCQVPDIFKYNGGVIPIEKEACELLKVGTNEAGENVYAKWVYVEPFNIPAPECRQNQYTRDNHLGNSVGGQTVSYNWTIPAHIHNNCIFRVRYNITTEDHIGFANKSSIEPGYTVADNNGYLSKYTGDDASAKARGYQLVGNPNVDIFGSLISDVNKVKLQLNINTAQFFRTFEDRSHRFAIRSREGEYPADAVIHNINVRGKRGNIVQTFPAVEYNYVPDLLDVTIGDYVHFQWTGSDSNPNNNDGQGRAGTDRSNVVGIVRKRYTDILDKANAMITEGSRGANYHKKLESNFNFLGWDNTTLINLATLASKQLGGDMEQLNDAGTYFDLKPKQVGKAGVYNYLCTRNNNFSNRSQKGTIKVAVTRAVAQLVGWGGGLVAAGTSALLDIPEGALNSVTNLALTVAPRYMASQYKVDTDTIASDIIYFSGPIATNTKLDNKIKIKIAHNASPIADTYIEYTPDIEAENVQWIKLKTDVSSSHATAWTDQPGVYVVRGDLNIGAIIGIVIGAIVLIAGAVFLIVYCKKQAERDGYIQAGIDPTPINSV